MLKVIQPGWSRSSIEADLLGRHDGRVEDVQPTVGGVGEPELLLVGRQADAVAGAAVPLGRPLLEALHLDPIQLLARDQVADLEARAAR